jgi:hypothetical protein
MQILAHRTGLQPDSISYFCNMRAARWWDALKLFEEMVRLRWG